ncbi:MAG: response regulator [Bryobacteraceae bacterium]|nr:response regulator [Bryobacteraceae bacterium]
MPRPDQDYWKPSEVARLLALVESERRYYQELFAALPVPAAVFDRNLALAAANREFRARFDLQTRDLGGIHLFDLLPSHDLEEAVARVAEGPDTRAEASVEIGLREPRTSRVALRRTWGWREDSEFELLLSVEEVAAEPAAGLELPPPFIAWVLDEQAESFLWVSPGCEDRLGLPAEAWQSVTTWAESRVHAEDREHYLRFFRETLPQMGAGTIQYRLHDAAGALRRVQESAVRAGDGAFHGISLDATTVHHLAQRDRHRAKHEALQRLSGRLAHVANNLLMIISGYTEELAGSLPEGDTRRGDLEEILRASARLAGLTTQLTTFARPMPAGIAPFSWNEWAARHEPPAQAAGADWLVEGNADLLARFVEDVRHAAAAFAPSGATLEIAFAPHAESDEAEILIPLPGLTPEAADTFLEPFSGPREGPDPPIGPAAAAGALEGAGMTVFVDEDASLLRIRARARRVEAAAPAPPPEPRPIILLLEDEDGIRTLIEKALQRAGYDVLSAPWAEQVLAFCAERAEPVDLLISDIIMPGAGGREVAEKLRERWPSLRVLFISGHHDDQKLAQDVLSGSAAGTTLLLPKPFAISDLLSSVETLLGRRRSAAAGTS